MNLDEEFNKLMQLVIDKINEGRADGTYDEYDADYLLDKVANIADHGDSSNYGNPCPQGHTDPDCGWSPSMGYHCT